MVSLPSPMSVAAGLRQHIVGQREAQLTLSVALVNHLRRLEYAYSNSGVVDEFNKDNVLILGPTGSGKTHMVRTLARLMDLPLVMADATKITQAGYVGANVEDLLVDLWNKSGRSLDLAQRGIIFLDEVDKIRRNATEPDVNGEGVQRALLTLMNGSIIRFKAPGGDVNFDTKNVLFICAGAFVGLEDLIRDRLNAGKNTIGFGAQLVEHETKPSERTRMLLQVTAADLVAFGFIPEFVGRLPVRTAVQPLSVHELCRILVEPKNSLIRQARALHAGTVDIEFSKEALQAIATEAHAFGTGARALQEIVEEVVRPIAFSMPGGKVAVTREMVRDRKNILRKVASGELPSDVQPCRFSWAAWVKSPQQPAVAPSTPDTAASVPGMILREVRRRTGTGGDYIRLLEDPLSGQRVFHIHRQNLTGMCSCGCRKENIVCDRLVICAENSDPLSALSGKQKSAQWRCEACGVIREQKYNPYPSEWTGMKGAPVIL